MTRPDGAAVGTGGPSHTGSLNSPRIWLSPPHIAPEDYDAVFAALASNWIAPVGPHLERFEQSVAHLAQAPYAVAVVSGTAALHLALLALGVGPGDSVLVSDLTFVASANAVRYVGATPVFVDSETATWNMDPALLEEYLVARARRGGLPKAVIAVDLYGQVCRFDAILPICARFEVAVIEDAAEALGATYLGKPAGSFGDLAIFSFNGNKVITTSGGGMLVSRRADWVERARNLATQAREPFPYYEHSEVGYNYRLSNVLAALGTSQLARLEDIVARRRAIRERYRNALEGVRGVAFMPSHSEGSPSWWLTCLTVDSELYPNGRDKILNRLASELIEARPLWKPMHMQPLYRNAEVLGGSVAGRLFSTGLCLPSGSTLTDEQVDYIAAICLECLL